MTSNGPIKVGLIASCALALGVASSARAGVHAGFGRVYVAPASGAVPVRRSVKAAVVTGFTTLYNFLGSPDGANPTGQLLEDLHGNIYGTTQIGGTGGDGTVYEYSHGTVTALHSFSGPDGNGPAGGLLNSIGNFDLGGNLYGVTSSGGATKHFGVLYAVNSATRAFTLLHSFAGGLGGGNPFGRPILYADGNLYGTASTGGGFNDGLVYRLTPAGAYGIVACFNGTTGAAPIGGLAASLNGRSLNGSLFGVTSAGGAYGAGTVFSVNTSGAGKIVNIHSFNPATDGSAPNAALITDDNGNLYGTATGGGAGSAGTIFEISTAGKFTTLYSFPTDPMMGLNPNGSFPLARLASFLNGTLYGSAAYGGAMGGGTLFELKHGTFTILHSFAGTDGATPDGQLLLSLDGNIYGTASNGGAGSYGTLFALPYP